MNVSFVAEDATDIRLLEDVHRRLPSNFLVRFDTPASALICAEEIDLVVALGCVVEMKTTPIIFVRHPRHFGMKGGKQAEGFSRYVTSIVSQIRSAG